MMKIGFALGVLMLVSVPSWAEPASVQVSDEQTFGRVAISIVSTAATTLTQHGTKVEVTVPADIEVATPDNVPRNVVSMVGGRGSAQLTVLPGAHLKWNKERKTLVLRLLDPPARDKTSTLALTSHANPAKPAPQPQREVVAKPSTSQTSAAPTVAEPAPAKAEPEQATAETSAPPAEPVRPVVRAFTVSAGADVGLSTFRRGGRGVAIFDDGVALPEADSDGSTLRPTVQPIQHGTLMTVPLADDETLAVTRSDGTISVAISAATGSPAATTATPTGIRFQVAKPGRVMAVSDSVSGQTMLIGTTTPDRWRACQGRYREIRAGLRPPANLARCGARDQFRPDRS